MTARAPAIDMSNQRLGLTFAGLAALVIAVGGAVAVYVSDKATADARFSAIEARLETVVGALEKIADGSGRRPGDWTRGEALALCLAQHGAACAHPDAAGFFRR